MVCKIDILCAVDELGGHCSANDVSFLLGLDLAEAAVGLLRCYRAGLLERWKEAPSPCERELYFYDLTNSGVERLTWLLNGEGGDLS